MLSPQRTIGCTRSSSDLWGSANSVCTHPLLLRVIRASGVRSTGKSSSFISPRRLLASCGNPLETTITFAGPHCLTTRYSREVGYFWLTPTGMMLPNSSCAFRSLCQKLSSRNDSDSTNPHQVRLSCAMSNRSVFDHYWRVPLRTTFRWFHNHSRSKRTARHQRRKPRMLSPRHATVFRRPVEHTSRRAPGERSR